MGETPSFTVYGSEVHNGCPSRFTSLNAIRYTPIASRNPVIIATRQNAMRLAPMLLAQFRSPIPPPATRITVVHA